MVYTPTTGLAGKVAKRKAQETAAPLMTAQQMVQGQGTPLRSGIYLDNSPAGTTPASNTSGYNPNAVLVNGKPIDAGDNPVQLTASSVTGSTNSSLPAPTVATKQNPLVSKNYVAPKASYTPTDYSTVGSLDKDGLQDYIDQMQYKVQYDKKPLTQDEYLQLQKAQRRMAELSSQQSNKDPYADIISQSQANYESKRAALEGDNATKLAPQYAQIDDSYNRQVSEAERLGSEREEALQGGLSFSGFGRSTYAQEGIQKIKTATADNARTINLARDVAKQQALLAEQGVDAKILEGLQGTIDGLMKDSANFQAEAIKETNKLNREAGVKYEEKIQNIIELASKNVTGVSYDKATPEQKGIIDAYSTLAIDKDGDINEAIMKSVPADLAMAVLQRSALLKGAIPGEAAKTITVGKTAYQWNPATQRYDIPIVGGVGAGAGGGSGAAAIKAGQFSDILTAIDDLRTSPGKEGAVGASFQKILPSWARPGEGDFVPGSDAAGFAAKFNRLRDLLTLPNLDKLKGAMSDKDIQFLRNAATSLSLDMKEDEFDRTLAQVESKFRIASGAPTSTTTKDTYNPDWDYKVGDKFTRGGIEYVVQPDGNFYPVN